MPTLTVLAPDSALAMDEIARQLGEDAFILSTSQRDGMIEIKATNDPLPTPQRATSSRAPQPQAVVGQPVGPTLSEAIGEDAVMVLNRARTAPVVSAPSAAPTRAAPQPPGPAAVASVHALSDAGRAMAGLVPLRRADLDDLRDEIAQIRAQLAALGAVQPPTAPALPHADPVGADAAPEASMRQAGFSPAILRALADDAPEHGLDAAGFAKALARRIAAPQPLALLKADMVLVLGPSGAGRTTLCAKFAALAADRDPTRPVRLVEVAPEGATFANDALRRHARMLSYAHGIDVACDRWHTRDLAAACPQALAGGALQIVDLPALADLGAEGAAMLAALRARAGAKEGAVQVVLALPGSLGAAAIRAHLSRPEAKGALIALTKLDEGEIMPPEISALAEAGGRIGWLSGTRALTGSLSPGSAAIWQDYITECLGRA